MTEFGAPPDPAYMRFLEGLRALVRDPAGTSASRWHPADTKWYPYPVSDWLLEDLSIPDTAPGEALKEHLPYFAGSTHSWELQEFWVRDLFDRIQKVFARESPLHPRSNLVWSPSGGRWRNAIRRTSSLPPPSQGPAPRPQLPAECVQRVEQVREWIRHGYITHDQGQTMINAIVDECT